MICINSCVTSKSESFKLDIKDLYLKKGLKYFIVGASGSGKSTLIRTILGLEEYKGMIYKEKDGLHIMQNNSLFKNGLMYLSQEFALWEHLNVEEHINFTLSKGKSIKYHEETDYYISLVNLEKSKKQKPYTLSGGERQRLALSRALASKPDYLFLDEPFANIDIVQADMLMKMLDVEQKKNGFGIIKVTHHFIGIKDINSTIIVLENGEIIFEGTYKEILKKDNSSWINKWKALLP